MTRHKRGIELTGAASAPATDGPVSIFTFGALLKYRHSLTGYCRRCETSRLFDPSTRPAGETFVGRTFRCKDCRGVMELSLSPPAWERRE